MIIHVNQSNIKLRAQIILHKFPLSLKLKCSVPVNISMSVSVEQKENLVSQISLNFLINVADENQSHFRTFVIQFNIYSVHGYY